MDQLILQDGKPIYKQIAEWILQCIKHGSLQPGDRLPTERELAQQLGIARGTVKKAYKELADNNIVEVLQGSGTYVHSNRDVFDVERRAQATHMIDALLDKLESWNFSLEETMTLLRMNLAKRERTDRLVRVAIIDCNPESFAIFKQQLSYLQGVLLSMFPVDAVILEDGAVQKLQQFDLIVTTRCV